MVNTDVRVLVIDDKNQILLVLEVGGVKNLPGGKSFKKPSKWGLPGGRGGIEDKDEIDTARRETQDETGVWTDINSRIRIERRRDDHTQIAVIGYPVTGEIKVNPEEILDCRWFPRSVLWDEKFDMYASHRGMAMRLLQRLRR